jgi:nucleoside-diphosphate-sugar epimerase
VRDVEIVFHVLGTLVAGDLAGYRRVNVETVRLFLDACAEQGDGRLKRFVLVGSQGASGPNPAGKDRLSELDPCRPVSAYGRSKLEAEELTGRYRGRVPYTIVRPSVVYGPRDANLLTIFRSAQQKGWIPQVGKGPKEMSLVHARDLAEGIWLSALAEKSLYETYFLAGEDPYTSEDVCAALGGALDKEVKVRLVPGLVVQGMMLYADVASRWFGRRVLLNRDRLTTLSHPRWVCDVAKARRDLGYRPAISLADGFRDTYRWYRSEGWL